MINITKKEIIYTSRSETHYFAESMKDKEERKSIISNADDESETLFESYIDESRSKAIDLLGKYLKTDLSTDDNIIFDLNLPLWFDTKQEYGLSDIIKRLMIDLVLLKWYEVTYPERVPFYSNKCDNDISLFKIRINKSIILPKLVVKEFF